MKNIFIVEDDEFFAQLLKERLNKNPGYKAEIFSTGEECMRHILRRPDVIILDYFLNSENKDALDGLEILGRIRKYNQLLPVIILSSQTEYSVALKTIVGGAEQYVVKDENAFVRIEKILNEIF